VEVEEDVFEASVKTVVGRVLTTSEPNTSPASLSMFVNKDYEVLGLPVVCRLVNLLNGYSL
jgi:hypothetical protein